MISLFQKFVILNQLHNFKFVPYIISIHSLYLVWLISLESLCYTCIITDNKRRKFMTSRNSLLRYRHFWHALSHRASRRLILKLATTGWGQSDPGRKFIKTWRRIIRSDSGGETMEGRLYKKVSVGLRQRRG